MIPDYLHKKAIYKIVEFLEKAYVYQDFSSLGFNVPKNWYWMENSELNEYAWVYCSRKDTYDTSFVGKTFTSWVYCNDLGECIDIKVDFDDC